MFTRVYSPVLNERENFLNELSDISVFRMIHGERRGFQWCEIPKGKSNCQSNWLL